MYGKLCDGVCFVSYLIIRADRLVICKRMENVSELGGEADDNTEVQNNQQNGENDPDDGNDDG